MRKLPEFSRLVAEIMREMSFACQDVTKDVLCYRVWE